MGSWAVPASVLSQAQRLGAAIEGRVAGLGGRRIRLDATELVMGRAALLGLAAPTRISAGGASRLLATADGWCALTLSRDDDYEAIPALLQIPEVTGDPWQALAAAAATRGAAEFVERARLLDIPAAVLGEVEPSEPIVGVRATCSASNVLDLLVVDLSSMWAGPLCGRLLAAAGATVVKVETAARPDGTRRGDRRFFDWMNSEKLSCSTDFDSDELRRLLRAADVVIEGSRPAALARRGLSPDGVVGTGGRIWLRISGYGADHPDRAAFGDDAAVAGGLVAYDSGGPMFCADAIADPLTGLVAADCVLEQLSRGDGTVVDVSMAAVAATYARLPATGIDDCEPRVPRLPAQPAHELGADNERVRELVESRLVGC